MLTGRKYRLELSVEQAMLAEMVGSICRTVWNVGLEQQREYRRRGRSIGYVEQCRQMAEAKADFPWLAEAPSHVLQQVLRDLEGACRRHGPFRVRWRSQRRWAPSMRFPDGKLIRVEQVSRNLGRARLPKLGWVRFRW
ncbi:helix-turn-helix domain-containing protein [Kitasatospora sp. NPDC097643]|uniref:helix-turn-helix domain-containing protein n=1 Tax=Kitasatospora sp. NPDC097643 TaxID=3157230 RepID=UPI0033286717